MITLSLSKEILLLSRFAHKEHAAHAEFDTGSDVEWFHWCLDTFYCWYLIWRIAYQHPPYKRASSLDGACEIRVFVASIPLHIFNV